MKTNSYYNYYYYYYYYSSFCLIGLFSPEITPGKVRYVKEQPVGTDGSGFSTGQRPFLSLSQQYQSIDEQSILKSDVLDIHTTALNI